MTGYSAAICTSIRHDPIDYFIQCNTETMDLHKRTVNVLVHKGIINF
ncbi:hypothetical protein ACOI1C_18510 [Bacillus sp. DJP31]